MAQGVVSTIKKLSQNKQAGRRSFSEKYGQQVDQQKQSEDEGDGNDVFEKCM